MSSSHRSALSASVVGLLFAVSPVQAASISNSNASFTIDETTGAYSLVTKTPSFTFGGSLASQISACATSEGSDNIGEYNRISFGYRDSEPMNAFVNIYKSRPIVLLNTTCKVNDTEMSKAFPHFTQHPSLPHFMGYKDVKFSIGTFDMDIACGSGPVTMFDDDANTFVVCAADNFGGTRIEYANKNAPDDLYVSTGRQLKAAGFSVKTMMSFAQGVNGAHDAFGFALTDCHGKKRPAIDGDFSLKYLGYWTDRKAYYYYHRDPREYEDIFIRLVQRYKENGVRLGYIQLDSWWYPKGCNAAWDEKKDNGIFLYDAAPEIFPNGLKDFQQRLGAKFYTHARWIDKCSPYRKDYQFSRDVIVDPRWWDETMGRLADAGVIGFEQDWLDDRATPGNMELFFGVMAEYTSKYGMCMQYCMQKPHQMLQGAKYDNLTSIRVGNDGFVGFKDDYLLGSRFCHDVGAYPWVDNHRSSGNQGLIAVMSGGLVGFSDRIKRESWKHILPTCRSDGALVKADIPILPTEETYLERARGREYRIGYAYSAHEAGKVLYFLAKGPGLRFKPSDYDLTGTMYVYDCFNDKGETAPANVDYVIGDQSSLGFFIAAPVSPSGIAFLGDKGRYVSCGKQRVSRITFNSNQVDADIVFAPAESSILLHGYSDNPVTAVATPQGAISELAYDASTHRFSLKLSPVATDRTELVTLPISIGAD